MGELGGARIEDGGEPRLDTIKNKSPRSSSGRPCGPWIPGSPWIDVPGRTWLRSVESCERAEWTLLLWRRGAVDLETGELAGPELLRSPFLCGSWRCRRCARWRGAVDWSRARSGLLARRSWLYLVLTFDPSKYETAWDAFAAGGEAWDKGLRRAFERALGRVLAELRRRKEPIPEGATTDNGKLARLTYLQTWESTARGWPHANVVVSHPLLDLWLERPELGRGRKTPPGELEAGGLVERRSKRAGAAGAGRVALCPPSSWKAWLEREAEAAGFGRISWAELLAPRSLGSMAGYLVKLARELAGDPAEKKGDQTPLGAPRGFRRIRASVGMLPPAPAGSGEFSGMLSPTRWDGTDPGMRLTSSQRRAVGSPRALARIGPELAAPWLVELARREREPRPEAGERWGTWLARLAEEAGAAWERSGAELAAARDSAHGSTPHAGRDRERASAPSRRRDSEGSSALARNSRDDRSRLAPGVEPDNASERPWNPRGFTDRELAEELEVGRLRAEWQRGRELELRRRRGLAGELPLGFSSAYD